MDGHQSALENSFFQACQPQTGVHLGDVNNGSMLMALASVTSIPEQDSSSYVPWFHNSQDGPYELSFPKSRKLTNNADCDGEADLQGLVSNILDEADSQDGFYSDGLPTCSSIWSPKTPKQELLQYFQSEAKTLNSSFPSNHLSHEAFSKAQQQSGNKRGDELSQQPSGLAGNQQWHFNLPNGDNYSLPPHKPPPGLQLPKTLNTNPPQMQPMKYTNMLPCNNRETDQALNNLSAISDIFRPQNETSNSCFDAFHEDHYTQGSVNSFCYENCVPEDVNQLVSSFQSFVPSEHDGARHGDFPNMHKQTVGLHKEGFPEQWKITSPTMSTQNFPTIQIQKKPIGDLRSMQRRRISEPRKQAFKMDSYQSLPDFSYFQKSVSLPAHMNHPNQHQHKMTVHRENIDLSPNQSTKQQIQQSQMQKKSKSQTEREKKKMQMSGFLGESFSLRQQSNTKTTEGGKQPFSQYPYFDFQGNVQSLRLGEKNMVSVGNVQQFTPLMYPVNDLRRYSMPINSNLISGPTLAHGNGVPSMNMSRMMSANEAAPFNTCVSDMKACRGESIYGMTSTLATSLMMNQGGPVVQLYFYLEDCYEQWRCLEKERKRTEVILKNTFPGKRTTVMTTTNLPKIPPNLTRVDYLVFNLIREEAKVANLLDRMECLSSTPLHVNIHLALKNHHMALCITQARCKEGSANWTKTQQQGIHFTEDRDNLLMIVALKDLAATTRRLCTALVCGLQMTLPQPVNVQEHHAYEEATCTDRCSSPFQGYSFPLRFSW